MTSIPNIIPNPCTEAATNRNWDAVRRMQVNISNGINPTAGFLIRIDSVDGAAEINVKCSNVDFPIPDGYVATWDAANAALLFVPPDSLPPGSGGTQFVRFGLTDYKAAGTPTAFGKLLEAVGEDFVEVGDTVMLLDEFRMFGPAAIGSKGYAVAMPDHLTEDGYDAYCIVTMDAPARWIKFTSTGDMGVGMMSVAVDRWWGHPYNGIEPTQTTVHDPDNMFPMALSGAEGYAVLDEKQELYIVVHCNQQALHIAGTLGADISPDDTGSEITISGGVAQPHDGQVPPSLVAKNRYGLKADSGQAAWVAWDKVVGGYVILQVIHVKTRIMYDMRVDGATNKIQAKYQYVVVAGVYDVDESWTDIHTGTECA